MPGVRQGSTPVRDPGPITFSYGNLRALPTARGDGLREVWSSGCLVS